MHIRPFGRRGVLVELDDVSLTRGWLQALEQAGIGSERVPGWGNILITCAVHDTPASLRAAVLDLPEADTATSGRHHTVRYEAGGPDLDEVAAQCGFHPTAMLDAFEAATFQVECLGFVRGFAYMSGLDPRLFVPRRATPRQLVPAGSVAIAGPQTGIYPVDSPGGWNLIGRTLEPVFRTSATTPARFAAGDTVSFRRGPPELPPEPEPTVALPANPAVEVAACTGLVTIQDRGRFGLRSQGVGSSGAADQPSFSLANRLVGNRVDTAAFEGAFGEITLVARRRSIVAVTGAVCRLTINGRDADQNRALVLRPGDALQVFRPTVGLRVYVALRGGLDVGELLGSRSYDSLARLGPPPVGAGALFATGVVATSAQPWFDPVTNRAHPGESAVLTARPGPNSHLLDFDLIGSLLGQRWRVDQRCDRAGIRLSGESHPGLPGTLPSFALLPGSIQLPPDGFPIILGPDAGTTGGYPVVAVIDETDLPIVGQLRPGATVKINYRSNY